MPDNRQPQNPRNAVKFYSRAPPENLEEAMWLLNIQDHHEGADAKRNPYPERPGEPDCSYYMRTGSCGYGNNCRFHHPAHVVQGIEYRCELPERQGQPDCQHFLKTGTCKFGATCKYHHPRDRLVATNVQLNVLGFPMRPEEKSCPYYLRTGSCKFKLACKFHHPEPTFGHVMPETRNSVYESSALAMASPSSFPFVGGVSSWTSPRSPYMSTSYMQGLPAFLPVVIQSSQGMVSAQQSWSSYMGAINPALSNETLGVSQMSNAKPQNQSSSSTQVTFPERPDQPDCQYFLKTGSCKYGTSCKYHHPKEKAAQLNTISMGPHMLPLRPGQAICTYYSTRGNCKYGSTCKFDHPYPWPGYYGYTYPPISLWDSSALFPYQRSSPGNWTSSILPVPDIAEVPNAFPKPESGSKKQDADANLVEDQPPQAISPSQTAPSSGSTQDQSD